jgi:hypothetical protein
MRRRWIQDPVTLRLVPAEEYRRAPIDAPAVWGDIPPYREIIGNTVIEGRKAHREFLARNGCQVVAEPSARIKELNYEIKHGRDRDERNARNARG